MNHCSRFLKALLTVAFSILITSCAHHLDQQECQTLDLHQYGFNDGSKGLNQKTLEQESKDCSRFDITLNKKEYQRGWRAGTRKFCRPENGYELGVNGSNYNNVCPNDMAAKFRKSWRRGLRRFCVPDTGYNLGRSGKPMPNFCAPDQVVAFRNSYADGSRLFRAEMDARVEVNNINSQIRQKQDSINQRNADIKRSEAQANATDPNGRPLYQQRRQARIDIRNARWDIQRLNDDIDQLNRRRDRAQDRLSKLSAE